MPRERSEIVDLLVNAGATGAAQGFGGGQCHLAILAGTGGATTALEALGSDGATWLAVPSASSTVDTIIALDLPSGTYRATVTGGVTPAAIYAQLRGLP